MLFLAIFTCLAAAKRVVKAASGKTAENAGNEGCGKAEEKEEKQDCHKIIY